MRRKGVSYAKYGYIFCIPFVAAFLIFSLYPILFTLFIGFRDFRGLFPSGDILFSDPFRNFREVLETVDFMRSFKNTMTIWIVNFIPQIGLALLLTAWFTNHRFKIRGEGLFKVLYYMPNIITAATIAILFSSLFMYPTGVVNSLLMDLNIIDKPYYFTQDGIFSKGIVAFIQFWMWYGYTMIVLIAGVLGINPELFEAAELDGASGVQTFFKITLPNLRTILIFMLVTSLIGGLQMFDIPKMYLEGGPDSATLTTSLFIYNQAFSGSYLYDRAAAASILMFIVIAVLAAVIFFLLRDKHEIKLKKEKKAFEKMRAKEEKAARRNGL